MTGTETEKKTVTESMELVTGFDEIAIEKQFGKHFDELRPLSRLRALLFVDQLRQPGIRPPAAYETVMNLAAKDVGDAFADDDEEDEFDPEEPVSDLGKDDSPDE